MADEPTPDDGARTDDPRASSDLRSDGGSLLEEADRPFGLPRWAGVLLPIALLAVLLGVLVVAQPFAGIQTGAPLPDVTVSHVTLPHDEVVVLHVVNNGPDPVTVSQLLVDEAYWDYTMTSGGVQVDTLGPLQSATITIPYHWTPGWDLEVALVLADGTTIHHTIVAPAVSPGMTVEVLGLLAVIGILVGVIPVALGMLWFPFMRDLSDRWLHAVLLFAAGVLAFLAFDAGFEAFEVAENVPGAYEGPLLVVVGVVGAALLVQAVAARGTAGGEPSALTVAYLVALGIGLHNLAEGLAIGSSFALGRVSLGAFLVVGFMVHNVTEGPAVVAPLSRGERPELSHFLALGALAGAPVILGGWIGGLAFSPTLGALFLAIGVGAIIQVDWEIGRMVRERGQLGTATNILGFLVGFAVMYATDLLVAL